MPLSDQYELQVLRELHKPINEGWRSAPDIASEVDLPIYTVRASLTSLRRRGMVERGGPGHWGQCSITERGILELTEASQLRVVRTTFDGAVIRHTTR